MPNDQKSTGGPMPAGVLKARFNILLSEEIRPFLKARGFAKSGPTFFRKRGRLYDVINFQGSDANGTGYFHRFFVNIGIGSLDIDEVTGDDVLNRPSHHDCLVSHRWENFVTDAPYQVEILPDSDLDQLAEQIRHWVSEVVAIFDSVRDTDTLVDVAVETNFLAEMEKICTYLARRNDLNRLRRYVGILRDRFQADVRWSFFEHRITESVGPYALDLRDAGLLNESQASGNC